jgi:hypothetical protein
MPLHCLTATNDLARWSSMASRRCGVARPRGDPGEAVDVAGDGLRVALPPARRVVGPRGRLARCHTCRPLEEAEVLVHPSVRIWGCTYYRRTVASLFRVPGTAAR